MQHVIMTGSNESKQKRERKKKRSKIDEVRRRVSVFLTRKSVRGAQTKTLR